MTERQKPDTRHRCANCYVAQYQMKADSLCKNEWWGRWDAEHSEKQGAAL